ncbi:MAG: hypothetical protein HC767_00385 [Akkermansiaceae bacterium]|nr:hypothetical protein [Akkermansiaceae bacterium]
MSRRGISAVPNRIDQYKKPGLQQSSRVSEILNWEKLRLFRFFLGIASVHGDRERRRNLSVKADVDL